MWIICGGKKVQYLYIWRIYQKRSYVLVPMLRFVAFLFFSFCLLWKLLTLVYSKASHWNHFRWLNRIMLKTNMSLLHKGDNIFKVTFMGQEAGINRKLHRVWRRFIREARKADGIWDNLKPISQGILRVT